MASRAKYKVGQTVEFKFAGSNFIGDIGLIRNESSTYKYNIIDEDGTNYPVVESNVIRKL